MRQLERKGGGGGGEGGGLYSKHCENTWNHVTTYGTFDKAHGMNIKEHKWENT